MASGEEPEVFTVSRVNRLIRNALESQVGMVWIEGELSNVSRPSSGHLYFTLKDENAQISAAMFRGKQTGLNFELKNGNVVQLYGQVTVYEKGGRYQVLAHKMKEGGKGDLQARFEALKKKLHQEGLFSSSRKQDLPVLARHVGVVTSPTGAAIRDILNVVSRRYPNLHVLIAAAKVQGPGAAEEIAAGIEALNQRGGLDVLIVGRGGGGLEDLWCFNEEVVARAIAASTIPVISAVGHEVDITISDYVADLRAPTPSAAAELVVGRKEEFEADLANRWKTMKGLLADELRALQARVEQARTHYVFKEPQNAIGQYRQRIDRVELAMSHHVQVRVREVRTELEQAGLRLRPVLRESVSTVRRQLDDRAGRLNHAATLSERALAQKIDGLDLRLKAMNPLAVLDRGYSVTSREDGTIIHKSGEVTPGERLYTRLASGTVESEVTEAHDGE